MTAILLFRFTALLFFVLLIVLKYVFGCEQIPLLGEPPLIICRIPSVPYTNFSALRKGVSSPFHVALLIVP